MKLLQLSGTGHPVTMTAWYLWWSFDYQRSIGSYYDRNLSCGGFAKEVFDSSFARMI